MNVELKMCWCKMYHMKGAKPNEMICFDKYLKAQHIKIKTAVMKINSIIA